MRPKWSIGIAAVAIGVLVAALLVAAAPARPQPPTWEYKVVRGPVFPDDYEKASGGLNALGAEGWELVSVGAPDGSPTSGRYFYFKRLK